MHAGTTPNRRGWALTLIKLLIAGVVAYAVGDTLARAVRGLQASPLRPAAGWTLLAAAAYVAAFLPMAAYWRRVLAAWGQPTDAGLVLRGYYLGHLGKYVPGKAMVVVLRTGALRSAGGDAAIIATSVFVETLTLMSVGGVLAGLLLTIPELSREQAWWMRWLAFVLGAGSIAPVLPPAMNRLVAAYERRRGVAAAATLTWRQFGAGWLAALATWAGLAVSLWLMVRAFDPGFPLTLGAGLTCLLSVTLPVVAGFLSLIPGGLLVRDGLMTALLAPAAGPDVALAVTVLARLTWVASEAVVCVILKGAQWAWTPPRA